MNSIFKSLNDIFSLNLKSFGLISSDLQDNKVFSPPNEKLMKSESNRWGELLEIVKSGNKELLFEVIKNSGGEILYDIFPQTGDTLMHWACLSGNVDIIYFLKVMYENNNIDSKIPWLTIINRKNELHQTPLHWACTIENLCVIQFLIKEGANINDVDNKGVTPLIMSCQYGNTSGALFLILSGATIFTTDVEGDNALHWALYKGHAELACLLKFYGLNCDQRDCYGQTPLHFASLSGNINCVADLVEKDNVEINVYDSNSKTPLMLAAGRRYKMIVEYLKYHINKRINNLSSFNKLKYSIIGTPNKTKFPMIFLLMCAFLWGNPYYFYVIRPSSIYYAQFTNFLFIAFQCLMWFSFLMSSIKDPGYIKLNDKNYQVMLNEIKLLDNYRNMKMRDYKNPINQICHSCKSIRLIRSRHCKICDRCVDEMDHHCPYVGNCVGKRNRAWFLLFIILMNVVNSLAGYLLYVSYKMSNLMVYTVLFTAMLISIGLILGITINFFMCKQAVINLTLVEAQKWKKYNYLQNEDGNFFNPYHQGWFFNLIYFLNIKK